MLLLIESREELSDELILLLMMDALPMLDVTDADCCCCCIKSWAAWACCIAVHWANNAGDIPSGGYGDDCAADVAGIPVIFDDAELLQA